MNLHINGHIDIHTHILPGIDDGAEDVKETAQMLKHAAREETTALIATPHFIPGIHETDPDKINRAVIEVNELSQNIGSGITIYPGNELYLLKGACESVKRGNCLSLAGSCYVLCELPINEYPDNESITELEKLTKAGFTPVLAHPERYAWFDRGTDLFPALLQKGCLMQLNSDSLTGDAGKLVRKNAETLIIASMVHFISSDCHDGKRRVPGMKKAYGLVRRKWGDEMSEQLFYKNALSILDNKRYNNITESKEKTDA